MQDADIRAFRHSLRALERIVVAQFKDSGCCQGVSLAQCHALMEIESNGPLPLLDLAQGLGLDKSTMSRTVDGLVNIGLVERQPHPRDRRSVLLTLSEQGKSTCDNINRSNDALFRRVFDRLEPAKRESALAGFQDLVQAMAAETEGPACSSA